MQQAVFLAVPILSIVGYPCPRDFNCATNSFSDFRFTFHATADGNLCKDASPDASR